MEKTTTRKYKNNKIKYIAPYLEPVEWTGTRYTITHIMKQHAYTKQVLNDTPNHTTHTYVTPCRSNSHTHTMHTCYVPSCVF